MPSTKILIINNLLKAKSINGSEVIRDFDGWSWNNNIKKQSDFEYNLIFQNMMFLNLRLDDNFKEKIYEQNFQNPNLLLMLCCFQVTIIETNIIHICKIKQYITALLDTSLVIKYMKKNEKYKLAL